MPFEYIKMAGTFLTELKYNLLLSKAGDEQIKVILNHQTTKFGNNIVKIISLTPIHLSTFLSNLEFIELRIRTHRKFGHKQKCISTQHTNVRNLPHIFG